MSDHPLEATEIVNRSREEARIIAAAPTLLVACKAVVDYHEKQNALSADLATLVYDAVAQATGTKTDDGLGEADE